MFYEKNTELGKIYCSDLIPELLHCFTSRDTGVNDERTAKFMAEYFGVTETNFIHPTQTHSTNVNFAKEGRTNYPETDALILTNKEQAVYLKFADCTPVILYDKRANIGAVAHAGWRGTVGRIVPKTVEKMLEYTGSDITDIYALIGPAIGGCCYKVGDEVITGVKNSVSDTNGLIIEKTDGIYVDLKAVNKQQLSDMKIHEHNIDICPYCTSCRNDLFYSYRKENGTDLRHNAIIRLK